MKSFNRVISYLICLFFMTWLAACGNGNSSSKDSGDLLTKITPLVEASIPKYSAPAGKTGPLKSWSDFSAGDDPHLARYLGPDDGCSLFMNAEFYDIIVSFINSKVNSSFESSDSNVIITARTSLSIPVWGSAAVSGDFHDIDFSALSFVPEEYNGQIELKNMRVAVEKTATTERVFIFIDAYIDGVQTTLSSARFEKNGDGFYYEERYFEYGSSGNDGEGHIYIEKADDGDFIVKRLYYNSNDKLDRAIVTGNLNSNFYIRVAAGDVDTSIYAWNEQGGTETVMNDECFEVKSSNFTKQLPAGDDGSAGFWTGGVFPSAVNDSSFTGFDVRDLITNQSDSFQWWN